MKMRIYDWLISFQQPLNKDSVVIDCGGYWGDYTKEILMKFGCHVIIFEPNPDFYEGCRKRFKNDKRVTVLPQGLGSENSFEKLYINRDSTSLYQGWAKTDKYVVVPIIKLSDFIKGKKIDCLKLNCEGAEYRIIEDLHKNGVLGNIEEVVIQFHRIRGLSKKNSRLLLNETHELAFHYKWDLWRKRNVR